MHVHLGAEFTRLSSFTMYLACLSLVSNNLTSFYYSGVHIMTVFLLVCLISNPALILHIHGFVVFVYLTKHFDILFLDSCLSNSLWRIWMGLYL